MNPKKPKFSHNRKLILDMFMDFLLRDFSDYCAGQGFVPNDARLLTFLIDKELIPAGAIKKYTIKKAFAHLFQSQQINKTTAVRLLAARYNLSERTIWNLLR